MMQRAARRIEDYMENNTGATFVQGGRVPLRSRKPKASPLDTYAPVQEALKLLASGKLHPSGGVLYVNEEKARHELGGGIKDPARMMSDYLKRGLRKLKLSNKYRVQKLRSFEANYEWCIQVTWN